MSDKLNKTVRFKRRSKVETDDRGRSVWVDTVETAQLELVNTTMLKQILDSDDVVQKMRIKDAAESKDGMLAHNVQNDRFEVIGDEELQAILDGTDSQSEFEQVVDVGSDSASVSSDDAELELVSTQMLRRLFVDEDENSDDINESSGGGFDPYNSG